VYFIIVVFDVNIYIYIYIYIYIHTHTYIITQRDGFRKIKKKTLEDS